MYLKRDTTSSVREDVVRLSLCEKKLIQTTLCEEVHKYVLDTTPEQEGCAQKARGFSPLVFPQPTHHWDLTYLLPATHLGGGGGAGFGVSPGTCR